MLANSYDENSLNIYQHREDDYNGMIVVPTRYVSELQSLDLALYKQQALKRAQNVEKFGNPDVEVGADGRVLMYPAWKVLELERWNRLFRHAKEKVGATAGGAKNASASSNSTTEGYVGRISGAEVKLGTELVVGTGTSTATIGRHSGR